MILTRFKIPLFFTVALSACVLLAVPLAHADDPTSGLDGDSSSQTAISVQSVSSSSQGSSDIASSEAREKSGSQQAAYFSETDPASKTEVSAKTSTMSHSEEYNGQTIQVLSSASVVVSEEEDSAQEALRVQASEDYNSTHVNMYRLYNPNSGEHFYTSNLYEATSVASVGWQWEGVGWVAPVTSSRPVYRLYNPNAGDHHYTLSVFERDHLVSVGWSYEGIGWYSDAEDQIAVLRQYNPNATAGAHNFTTSSAEDEFLGQAGWSREGIAWRATNGSVVAIQGQWLITSAWGTLQRYWIDSTGTIAKSRLISSDEGAGYDAYATSDGSVLRGKQNASNGYVYVADNDGRLAATSDGRDGWLITGAFDEGMQRYYYSAASHAMRTGFFTIGNSQYYGVSGQGYVLRGKMPWGRYVLLADNDGVLASGTGWISTDKYDGGVTQKYYLEKCKDSYSGAKTGLFEIDGVNYYGVSGQGYVVESSSTIWTNGWWYSLNNGYLTELAPDIRNRVNQFVQNMKNMALDDSHGYDQEYRWGERGDFDCSSLVVYCLKQAGFATGNATYTGNMRSNLVDCGWEWRASFSSDDLQPGVILLNERNHTAAMISTTQLAHASINENGSTTGGQPGDQTGREVTIRDYYNYPWDGILIPTPWVTLS